MSRCQKHYRRKRREPAVTTHGKGRQLRNKFSSLAEEEVYSLVAGRKEPSNTSQREIAMGRTSHVSDESEQEVAKKASRKMQACRSWQRQNCSPGEWRSGMTKIGSAQSKIEMMGRGVRRHLTLCWRNRQEKKNIRMQRRKQGHMSRN